ncbi:MAG: elongation factor P [Patescibacteria group bacterium]
MLGMNDLKTGVVINFNNAPHEVVKYQHSKMGRGGAVVRTTLKNLITGNNIENTFRDSDKLLPADMQRTKAQYLYRQGDDFMFMDMTSFEQFQIPGTVIAGAGDFLSEGLEVTIKLFEGKPINIELPAKMNFKVTYAEPAIKGDTANNPTKNATIETGLEIRVPMFINQGETIVVDTRDGSYIERAK